MIKSIVFFAALAVTSMTAQAACYGSSSYQNCTDNSGNSYSVQRYGNTTAVQGNNAQTGSSWNQTSSTYGNTTYHNGTAANGNSWSGSTTNLGNMQIHQGTDSNGRSYSKTCNSFGCF